MAAGFKTYRLRGGVDEKDFPGRDISLKDVRDVGRIAWEKWGHMIADKPIRDLISLAYAEGLYHGAMIALRDPKMQASMIGSNPSGVSSVAELAGLSATNGTETPNVRDLLESL